MMLSLLVVAAAVLRASAECSICGEGTSVVRENFYFNDAMGMEMTCGSFEDSCGGNSTSPCDVTTPGPCDCVGSFFGGVCGELQGYAAMVGCCAAPPVPPGCASGGVGCNSCQASVLLPPFDVFNVLRRALVAEAAPSPPPTLLLSRAAPAAALSHFPRPSPETQAGFFKNKEKNNCEPCPSGSFSPEGAPTCTRCAKGTYAREPGTAECSRCEAGQQVNHDLTGCDSCGREPVDSEIVANSDN